MPSGIESRVASRRSTQQRTAVRQALSDQDAFCSAQEIHARLRAEDHQVGLATVYRHLRAFAADGLVDAIYTADGETVYRLCGATDESEHHHHLVCRVCGHAEEVEGRTVERWTDDIAHRYGYTDIDHTIEVFGTCPACAGLPDAP